MKDVIWTVLFKCVVTSELEIASWAVLVAVGAAFEAYWVPLVMGVLGG